MEPAAYQAWLTRRRRSAAHCPQRGEQLFNDLACNTCHRNDGSGRGPSLVNKFGSAGAAGRWHSRSRWMRRTFASRFSRRRSRSSAGYQPVDADLPGAAERGERDGARRVREDAQGAGRAAASAAPRRRTGKTMATQAAPLVAAPAVTYLNHEHGVASWLLTKDHKRIGIMYLARRDVRLLPRRRLRLRHPPRAGHARRRSRVGRHLQQALHDARRGDGVLRADPGRAGDSRQLRAAADARRQGRRVSEDQPSELVRLRHRVPVHRLRDGGRRRRYRLDLLHAVQQPRLEHQRDDDRASASSSPAFRRSSPA